MKKLTSAALTLVFLLILTACNTTATQKKADYNIDSFENALNNGEDLTDKTVVFNVEKTSHNILSGNYSLLAGTDNNLSFKSKKDPKVSKNDIVIVKVKKTTGLSGIYNVSYNDLSTVSKMKDVSVKHAKIKQKKLELNISDDQVADENGKVKIKGNTTLPNTKVTIGMGILGDSTTSDSKGNFTLSYDIVNYLKSDSIKVNASIGDKKVTKTINVKQNQKIITSYESSIINQEKIKEKENKTSASTTTSSSQEQKEPSTPATEISFAELMNKLNNNQLAEGEVYTFNAGVIAKSGKNYPDYWSDNINNHFVRLCDPNNTSSTIPVYAESLDVSQALTSGSSSSTPTFTAKIVSVKAYGDEIGYELSFLITSINGEEQDISDFKYE
ncbi:hypothetical protein [Pseudolactococcus chungangensis]|uniref:hypothetical protein n=1 Tax=Pseudolactococcus chungangensis TaxID=451457 RepID=UPI0028D478F9|nr:hypothetical protein [Lactococcus chungangensis]